MNPDEKDEAMFFVGKLKDGLYFSPNSFEYHHSPYFLRITIRSYDDRKFFFLLSIFAISDTRRHFDYLAFQSASVHILTEDAADVCFVYGFQMKTLKAPWLINLSLISNFKNSHGNSPGIYFTASFPKVVSSQWEIPVQSVIPSISFHKGNLLLQKGLGLEPATFKHLDTWVYCYSSVSDSGVIYHVSTMLVHQRN